MADRMSPASAAELSDILRALSVYDRTVVHTDPHHASPVVAEAADEVARLMEKKAHDFRRVARSWRGRR